MASRRRVNRQPVYVLQRRPYSENSVLLDSFSREFGRVPILAKGARKLKAGARGLVHPFTPLMAGWSGKRELMTLTSSEAVRRPFRLRGDAMMCAWYANELIIRLLHRFDPHEHLFDAYEDLLVGLELDRSDWHLRLFEKQLLAEVGYGLVLDCEVDTGNSIESGQTYRYHADQGPLPDDGSALGGIQVSGKTLLALRNGACPGPMEQREAKQLTRYLLARLLEGKALTSRHVLKQMHTVLGSASKSEI